jgi:putative ABC transport system permease protein
MPSLPPGVRRAFRLASRPTIDAEVEDEVAFHLEMRTAELVARGRTPDDARAEALRRFGDTHHWSRAMSAVDRERVGRERRAEWLDALRQDLRYGVRALRRAPLFTFLAVLTLALGIGANAAVFGVVKSVLLDALPYASADRVVRVYGRWASGMTDRGPLSIGTVRDVRERQRSFERMAMFEASTREATLLAGDDPRVVKLLWTEPELFRTLGVAAGRGRLFRDEDMQADTAWNVVMTHEAWQKHFGGDPGIVGGTVRVNGIPRTVVGILPRGFVGPEGAVDFYFPLLGVRRALADPVRVYGRQNYGLVGRLRPTATLAAAVAEVAAIGSAIAAEQTRFNSGVSLVSLPVRDAMVGDTRTPLLVLMASAGLVLVITCANLAGAMLSRTLSRRKEFAVRAALGAGRGRLVRQLLTESTVLAVAGGAAGVLLALAGLRAVGGLALLALPPYADLSLDRGALLFTSAVAVASGLAFGLAPALSVRRADVQGTLRDASRGASEGRRARALRGVLVAGQIALCVTLLAGAGLLARSLWAMAATPLGFAPDGVLAAAVQLPPGRPYNDPAERVRFIEQFERRLRALPGVTAVAATGEMPTRTLNRNGFTVEGAPPAPTDAPNSALYETVADDYFRALGIPLREGRAFGPQDRPDGPPVVIVSEGLARRQWPDGKAIGRRLRFASDAPWMEVVGVVADVANDPTRLQPYPATYLPLRQTPWIGPIFLLRTAGDPATLAGPVRRALAAQDPRVPLHHATPMRALVAEGLSGRRLPVLLMTAFGALALLLASVGVYAMFAALAAAREREFGVRVALGASRGGIARLVLRQGAGWMAAGLVGGGVGVMLLTRLVRGLLYGVAPFDPVTLGATAALLIACAVIALLGPVRRATRVDPITVLR